MRNSWRWHTTSTTVILSVNRASGISVVSPRSGSWELSVCLHRHVHDLLESLLLRSFLQRLDLLLSGCCTVGVCAARVFVQSGFSSSVCSLPLGVVRSSLCRERAADLSDTSWVSHSSCLWMKARIDVHAPRCAAGPATISGAVLHL